jgi:hypothetical protein
MHDFVVEGDGCTSNDDQKAKAVMVVMLLLIAMSDMMMAMPMMIGDHGSSWLPPPLSPLEGTYKRIAV